MRITFVELNCEACRLLEQAFKSNDNFEVSVHCGDFYDYAKGLHEEGQKFAIVSPANSFGLMDGGYDEAIRLFYLHVCNINIIEHVQSAIMQVYGGEQPVGTCLGVLTSFFEGSPTLYHIPTMPYPMDVSDTNNAYMAMKALMLQLKKDLEYETMTHMPLEILVPVFCGGYGHMPINKAVNQMKLAWNRFSDGYNCPDLSNWGRVSCELVKQNQWFLECEEK